MELDSNQNEKTTTVLGNPLANTHTFKLLSGVECEVREFTGEHSELFTKENVMKGTFIEKMLLAVIVRVGSEEKIDAHFVKSMLSGDRIKVLFEARQFTQGFPETYEVGVEFGKRKQFFSFNMEDFEEKPYQFQCKEYEEVLEKQKVNVELPKSKKKVYFYLLDGHMEQNVRKINTDKATYLTEVGIRKPCFLDEKGNETLLNMKPLSLMDVNYLNAEMLFQEGTVDTTARVVNQNDPTEERQINLIAMKDFFFPSHR